MSKYEQEQEESKHEQEQYESKRRQVWAKWDKHEQFSRLGCGEGYKVEEKRRMEKGKEKIEG